jgi:uroporphyrin-III C-methyltransferase / precorrin-2 dehydrogenase / sirohydrochlorin ferrochelatase
MSAIVSLVGAGPGDPELLTIKAVNRLQRADIVFHDALISEGTLSLVKRGRLVHVGKRASRDSTSQEHIHELLIAAAEKYRYIVRLKGGDPFVFGRGGEEMLALQEANVAYEIIPGISSAIAAPALAGIPVTHRGISSAFLVVSGHCPDVYQPLLQDVSPHSATVVVLMGGSHRRNISKIMIERGWNRSTPVALLSAASTEESTVWTGNLEALALEAHSPETPVTLVIGEVVALANIHEFQKEAVHAR